MKNLNWVFNRIMFTDLVMPACNTIYPGDIGYIHDGDPRFISLGQYSVDLVENFLKKLYTKEKNNAILA